jgi:alanine-synthesizing transaminase
LHDPAANIEQMQGWRGARIYDRSMEFRRIPGLPPYVFTIIDGLKVEARRNGRDVIDLGFGNPDIPSPEIAVEKLAEAARNTRNHRYSASRGIPKLREAVADLYQRRFGVTLDPETQVISTIGAKEGFSHLMWVLLQPGDVALVPSPSYPIHIWGPYFAGADSRQIPVGDGEDFVENVMEAWELGWPKPRVVVLSFPHNPTTATVEKADLQRLVDWARERDVVLVHDFAYAETAFDGWKPPSILECEGANECAVELYSMTKSFSMAGWRVAFLVGNPEVVGALGKLKSYLDYGTFQPIQIAATVTLNEAQAFPEQTNAIYQSRRDTLLDGLARIGWEFPKPKGTMFAWAPIPEPYKELGSIDFAKLIVTDCDVALSPGVGFGAGGDGHVRFALIENEQRIAQAVRNLKRGLTKLG